VVPIKSIQEVTMPSQHHTGCNLLVSIIVATNVLSCLLIADDEKNVQPQRATIHNDPYQQFGIESVDCQVLDIKGRDITLEITMELAPKVWTYGVKNSPSLPGFAIPTSFRFMPEGEYSIVDEIQTVTPTKEKELFEERFHAHTGRVNWRMTVRRDSKVEKHPDILVGVIHMQLDAKHVGRTREKAFAVIVPKERAANATADDGPEQSATGSAMP